MAIIYDGADPFKKRIASMISESEGVIESITSSLSTADVSSSESLSNMSTSLSELRSSVDDLKNSISTDSLNTRISELESMVNSLASK